jgi:hypothetical protein
MVTFSPEFAAFLDPAMTTTTTTTDRIATTTLRVAGQGWTVRDTAAGFSLQRGAERPSIERADLGSVEKTLAMQIGPAMRRGLGLPPEGFLPDIFSLAPGFAWISTGSGMALTWREGHVERSVVTRESEPVESLHTYRSQYLRHSLRAILDSFLTPGPGIFTDEAPDALRPFRLPERTHQWISTAFDATFAAPQCVFYNELSFGLRISVIDGGFRVDRRAERTHTYRRFQIWAASMEVLQVYLAWSTRNERRAAARPQPQLEIPRADRLADGFEIQPIELNDAGDGRVQLVRNGVVQAVLGASAHDGYLAATSLSQLLAIGLDALELSILDAAGAPALSTR